MKGKKLLENMNLIDDELIEASERYKEKKNKRSKKYLITACSLLLIILGFYIRGIENKKILEQNISDNDIKEDSESELYYGVTIPKIEVKMESSGEAMDMIALIVYKNDIYTQSQWYYGEQATKLKALVGEKLGYAKGKIDEWSTSDEYVEDFSSNIAGDVYSVKGFSDEFRICMTGSFEEEGETVDYIYFFENLNGITISNGKELFGDRLQLASNYDTIEYLNHDDWNSGKEIKRDITENIGDITDKFINELYEGEFISLEGTDIYDNPSEHIYVNMKDGSTIELRIFDEGYVGYQPLEWCFIKVPKEIVQELKDRINR